MCAAETASQPAELSVRPRPGERDHRRWTAWHPDALPEGLPARALTTVQLGNHEYEGNWAASVGGLVLSALEGGCPVLYVQCGGLGSYYDGEDELKQTQSPLLRVFEDSDLYVRGPALFPPTGRVDRALGRTEDGRPVYSCHLPSVDGIRAALAVHERANGPALLLLSEAQLMRPYWELSTACTGLRIPAPDGLELTAEQIDQWRTDDLVELVSARAAPTVAVWGDTELGSSALTKLVDASRVHVTVLDTSPHATLQIRWRRSCDHGWDEAVPVLVAPAGETLIDQQSSGPRRARRKPRRRSR